MAVAATISTKEPRARDALACVTYRSAHANGGGSADLSTEHHGRSGRDHRRFARKKSHVADKQFRGLALIGVNTWAFGSPNHGPIGDPMRFFFNVRDRLEIEDVLGREFPGIPQAVDFARQLAADIRCLEPTVRPALAIDVIKETAERVHREAVFA